ncbi:hypothetical protein [Agreia sp.]|uniref:DUF4190 domain-containing protein n=1 Tax=Agreia sp. TaxID=1872416 RepID=UPI0035BBD6A9
MTDPNTPSTEGTPSVPPLPPTAPSAPSSPSYGAPSAPATPPAHTPPAAPAYTPPSEQSTPSYGAPSYQQAPPANPYAQAPNGAAPYGQPYSPVASAPKTLSLIGMIAGIVGIVVSLFGFGFGLVFSIGAVVLGFLGKKREPAAKGFWLTAIITGFAGIALSIIFGIVLLFIIIGTANSGYSSY